MENPPTLRAPTLGWDLQTLDRARIVEGEKLRVASGDRKVVELFPDGVLLAIGSMGDFLGWPRTQEQFEAHPEVNSLALAEFLLNFGLTYLAVAEFVQPKPTAVRVRSGFRNLQLENGNRVYLARGLPGRIGFPRDDGQPAPDVSHDFAPFDVEVTGGHKRDAEKMAFRMAKQIYNWFGHADEVIPFANLNEETLAIENFLQEASQ